MDELYEYLKEKLNEMYGGAGDGIVSGIIEFQDDMCDNGRKKDD
jgi:hypothetical protein